MVHISISYKNRLKKVAARFILYMEEVVNHYIKFFEKFCQLSSTIEQGAFPSTSEL